MKQFSLNLDWLFSGASAAKTVNLPHDAMLAEHRSPEYGAASGYYPGGSYSYTRSLFGSSDLTGKCLILEFEGIYMDSHVFLNGEEMGGHYYGYSQFFVDITGKLREHQNNTLTVAVDNSHQPNSRWYTGSGIYRDVWLWVGNPGCIAPEGLRVKTISVSPPAIAVSCDLVSGEGCLSYEVLDGETVLACSTDRIIPLPDAQLWSAETPKLYKLRASLTHNHEIIDSAEVTFGIRQLQWNARQGLVVNGKSVKLKGGCLHHDHGILGAAAYEKAELRRVAKLKEMGFNALRYSHNPAGKAFLRACDQLGMYVIDEAFDQWQVPQTACDYANAFDREWEKDITAMVSKDYNHPCVIAYCVGNEITDVSLPTGGEICKSITSLIRKLDDSRPTTLAVNTFLASLVDAQAKRGDKDLFGSEQVNEIVTLIPQIIANSTPKNIEEIIHASAEAVDIMGYNYSGHLLEGTHEMLPKRVMAATESYPHEQASNWALAEKHPYIIGDFQWTAWDYLGEAGLGLPVYDVTEAPFTKDYPCRTGACGSMDLTGFPETAAWYSAILWGAYQGAYMAVRPVTLSDRPYTLGKWRLTDSIPSWTWPGCEGKTAFVEVYAKGHTAQLYCNAALVAAAPLKDCRADFELPYEAGKLHAIILDENGTYLCETSLSTAGGELHLEVLPEQTAAAPGEIVYVPIHLTDKKGTLCMTQDIRISVTVTGGSLLALGSGNPLTEESYLDSTFTSWHGRVLAVIQAHNAGSITVTASSMEAGSAHASISLQ